MPSRVCVVNDDGYEAPGLLALVKALAASNICEVYVIAPDSERSAQSHAITVKTDIEVTPVEIPGAKGAYKISGTPADCGLLAVYACEALFGVPRVDLLASGINAGKNTGSDVVYSGTVAGAREVAIHGTQPAIAASLHIPLGHSPGSKSDPADYTVAAEVTTRLVAAVLESPTSFPCGAVLNVNVAAQSKAALKGLYVAHQGWTDYKAKMYDISDRPDHLRRPPIPQVPVPRPPSTRQMLATAATVGATAVVSGLGAWLLGERGLKGMGGDRGAPKVALSTGAAAVAGALGCFRALAASPCAREAPSPRMRVFRNGINYTAVDKTPGSDDFEMRNGWATVTPLGNSNNISAPGEKLGDVRFSQHLPCKDTSQSTVHWQQSAAFVRRAAEMLGVPFKDYRADHCLASSEGVTPRRSASPATWKSVFPS